MLTLSPVEDVLTRTLDSPISSRRQAPCSFPIYSPPIGIWFPMPGRLYSESSPLVKDAEGKIERVSYVLPFKVLPECGRRTKQLVTTVPANWRTFFVRRDIILLKTGKQLGKPLCRGPAATKSRGKVDRLWSPGSRARSGK